MASEQLAVGVDETSPPVSVKSTPASAPSAVKYGCTVISLTSPGPARKTSTLPLAEIVPATAGAAQVMPRAAARTIRLRLSTDPLLRCARACRRGYGVR